MKNFIILIGIITILTVNTVLAKYPTLKCTFSIANKQVKEVNKLSNKERHSIDMTCKNDKKLFKQNLNCSPIVKKFKIAGQKKKRVYSFVLDIIEGASSHFYLEDFPIKELEAIDNNCQFLLKSTINIIYTSIILVIITLFK